MHFPRFQGENVERNLELVEVLRRIATAWAPASPSSPLRGWRHRGRTLCPVGARRRDRLREALGALDLALTSEDLAEIENAVPKGAAEAIVIRRHGKGLDSERAGQDQ